MAGGTSTVTDRRWLSALALALSAMALLFGVRAAGAEAFQMGLSGPVPTTDWEAVSRSGAEFVHFQTSMGTYVEKGKNVAAAFDGYFKIAAEHNLTLLPFIYGTSHDTPGSSAFPVEKEFESSAEPWGEFLSQLAARYGPGGSFWTSNPSLSYHPVTTWEIWNEENLIANNPGKASVQPALYAQFLKFAHNRIVAKQPSAKVLMGGLLYLSGSGGTNMGPAAFLTNIKGAEPSLGAYFSGAAAHPYAGSEASFQEDVKSFHTNLGTQFPGKSIWITEFGWPTEIASPWGPAQSEEGQASLLHQSFDWLKGASASYAIEGAAWFQYRDTAGAGVGSWEQHAGLLNSGAAPKQAWFAYEEETAHPFWPVSGTWYSDNIGGNITSDPDISSWEPGRLDVFAKGTSENLVHAYYAGGFWSGWESISGGLTSGPGADSSQPGRIDVVGVAPGGSVAHWWFGGAWYSDNLGGTATADPDISDWGPEHLDVFIRGAENELWHRFWNGAWSPWELVGGPAMSSGPSSVSWGNGRIDVVARLTNGSVGHWWWTGGGWAWDNLGGYLAPGSKPAIASMNSGRLDVFGQGKENGLWHDKWTGSGTWSGWERIGGPITSSPGAVSPEPGRIDVVARFGASSVGHWWSYTP